MTGGTVLAAAAVVALALGLASPATGSSGGSLTAVARPGAGPAWPGSGRQSEVPDMVDRRDLALVLSANQAAIARQRAAAQAAAAQAARQAQQQAEQQAQQARQPQHPPAPVVPAGAAQQIAESMLASYGWPDSQFSCLVSLWNVESGWRVNAENPSSGAYGIPQALPGSKMASAGSDWQTNPATQIRWGLGYIKGQYGSPCGAWDHEQADGWY